MTGKIAEYLEAYRKVLIIEYAALVDREKRDDDKDAGEEARRLISEIIELRDLIDRLDNIKSLH